MLKPEFQALAIAMQSGQEQPICPEATDMPQQLCAMVAQIIAIVNTHPHPVALQADKLSILQCTHMQQLRRGHVEMLSILDLFMFP